MVRPRLVELPALREHVRLDDRDADRLGQLLQPAEDQRAVRPGAGERDVEMVAAGLGLEAALAGRAGRAVGRHPVAEQRLGRARSARRRRSCRAACPICRRPAVPCDLSRRSLRTRRLNAPSEPGGQAPDAVRSAAAIIRACLRRFRHDRGARHERNSDQILATKDGLRAPQQARSRPAALTARSGGPRLSNLLRGSAMNPKLDHPAGAALRRRRHRSPAARRLRARRLCARRLPRARAGAARSRAVLRDGARRRARSARCA